MVAFVNRVKEKDIVFQWQNMCNLPVPSVSSKTTECLLYGERWQAAIVRQHWNGIVDITVMIWQIPDTLPRILTLKELTSLASVWTFFFVILPVCPLQFLTTTVSLKECQMSCWQDSDNHWLWTYIVLARQFQICFSKNLFLFVTSSRRVCIVASCCLANIVLKKSKDKRLSNVFQDSQNRHLHQVCCSNPRK